MTTIWYQDITEVLLSIADPNTGWAISEVPWVSSPKINAGTSVYNIQAEWWEWIAWWSTNVSWSSSAYDSVSWSSWYIYMPDWTSLSVSSWSASNMWSMTYIYYDMSNNTMNTTTSASGSVGEDKLLLCVAKPTVSWKEAEYQAFGTGYQSTFITADNIAANTITANEIASNTITASQIATNTITANEMNVSQLSAISANLWTVTAWTISWTTITAGDVSNIAVKLDPTAINWRIEFYEWWNQIGTMSAWTITQWNAVIVSSNYIGLGTNVICLGKLKIPVWTDLYD
jgi:hypothetical protein